MVVGVMVVYIVAGWLLDSMVVGWWMVWLLGGDLYCDMMVVMAVGCEGSMSSTHSSMSNDHL